MLTFQEIILKLYHFWEKQGCLIHQGYDVETGAGTFNPATFLRCLGPEPYKAAYVEPSRRPSDGRYGQNPNRLQLFHQFQIVIKPSPPNILDLYKESLQAIEIDLKQHDLRFVHDDWESPTIGAFGLGWEVWIDGMEVSQFTYFQGLANLSLNPITVEITYGLERLCMYVQNKSSFFDMQYNEMLTYGEIYKQNEIEWSIYNYSQASTEMWQRHFDDFEKEAQSLIAQNLPLPAYDFVMKASHAFNLLEARGVISVTERTSYIGRIRDLARLIAKEYLRMREELGFPLLNKFKQKQITRPSLPSIPEVFVSHRKETFLFEIGSEELPATFVPIGMENLEKSLRTLLKEHELAFDFLKVFGTPKRLGAIVEGLVEGTEEKIIERKGPNIEKAFSENGKPTKQGEGFLKANGFAPLSLEEIESGKVPQLAIRENHLLATLKQEGKSLYQILSQALPKLILKLEFPKKMHWEDPEVVYPRPIRWIVALYFDQVIPFNLGSIQSNHFTFGHAQLDSKKIFISEAKEYFSLLKEHKVLANVEERRQSILNQIKNLEASLKGQTLEKKKVLAQVLFMTEWPLLTPSEFDADFLKIPPEVLISEMVEHQKYFPFADAEKKLSNIFLITSDTNPNELIRKGNQRVLSARLADGAFLYEQDLKQPLESYNKMLAKMTFQKKLGSMQDKIFRIEEIAARLNDLLRFADAKKLARAALLCKSDLATTMVGEFPELQGTIGKYYALAQKENKEVASGIEEHWMPRTESGQLPQSPVGILLSLADKLDNLICYFQIGLKPTSSSDPYALRRQTIGIIKILVENQLSLNLSSFINEEVLLYLTHRAKNVFEQYGFAKDAIDASIRGLCTDPYDQYCKLQALHNFRKEKSFAQLLEVYKRAKGQLEKSTPGMLDPKLIKEPAEKELFSALKLLEKKWPPLLKQKKYAEAFGEMAKLQSPLAHLFDTVKILADDLSLQANRLALLDKVFSHFEELLDFSRIQLGS